MANMVQKQNTWFGWVKPNILFLLLVSSQLIANGEDLLHECLAVLPENDCSPTDQPRMCFWGLIPVFLGVDSPFFSTIVLFKTSCFPWGSDGFPERRIPGKNGKVSPRILKRLLDFEPRIQAIPLYWAAEDQEELRGRRICVEGLPQTGKLERPRVWRGPPFVVVQIHEFAAKEPSLPEPSGRWLIVRWVWGGFPSFSALGSRSLVAGPGQLFASARACARYALQEGLVVTVDGQHLLASCSTLNFFGGQVSKVEHHHISFSMDVRLTHLTRIHKLSLLASFS